MSKNVCFSIDVIKNYATDEDADFAIVRLKFLSDGENSHGIVIPTEVLKENAHTIQGKFIVAKYNSFMRDVEGHNPDEAIVGYIPPDAEITFEPSKNGLFATVDGVISKLYATQVYELYKDINHRSVSVEFTCEYEDNNEKKPLVSFNIRGVTLLGLHISPSCKLANSEIVRFSQEDAYEYYHKQSKLNMLQKFSKERREKMAEKTYKVDKSKESMVDTPWGDVDKTELRNKIMEANNRATLVKDVYLVVESGWEDAPSEHLKYPVMQLKGDTFVYNKGGLSSALGYAKAEGASAVVSKVEKIRKKLGLDGDEEDKEKMATNKFSELEARGLTLFIAKFGELEGRPLYAEVIKRVQKKLGNHFFIDSIEDNHIRVHNAKTDEYFIIPANIKIGKDDEDMSIEIDYDAMKKSKVQKFEEDDNDDDKDGEGEGEGEKMSADANVDAAAYAEMLKRQAEENETLAKQLGEKEDIIMGYEQELTELRKFRDDRIEQDKTFAIEQTLNEIKDFVTKDEIDGMREEGMACKFEEITGWQNKIKSVAFESAKKAPHKPSLWKMAAPVENQPKGKGLWD